MPPPAARKPAPAARQVFTPKVFTPQGTPQKGPDDEPGGNATPLFMTPTANVYSEVQH